MQSNDWIEDSYFSGFSQPPTFLLDVIQLISNIYMQGNAADCSSLIYTMHVMYFQRLANLNIQIKAFEYLLQSYDNLVQKWLLDDASFPQCHKKIKNKKEKS